MTTEPHTCFNAVTVIEKASETVRSKRKSDKAFAGYTHALSGLAVSLLLLAFIPEFVSLVGLSAVATMVAFVMCFVGATLVPDLDNTQSTSRNSLGFFGIFMSNVFRVTSQIIQTVIRLPKDDPTPNPHRGFYHTILSAALIGGVVWLLTAIEKELGWENFGAKTWGDLVAVFFLFILTHLTFSSLGKSYFKKIKKGFFAGEVVSFLISLGCAVLMFVLLPPDGNYIWLAVAVTLGCVVHIIGDGFTRYGVPLIFPIPYRKKMWWNFRFAKLESGGEFEKTVFPILFGLASVVGLVKIVLNFMNS